MKSMKSEDLSKDLQVSSRISPQTVKDFMMDWMNRTEIKRNSDLWPQIYVQMGPIESPAFN